MALSLEMEQMKIEEEFDNPGLGCALELFSEIDEIMNMISDLKTIFQDPVKFENAHERYTHILSQYQEQPHLLDPHLDKMINSLLDYILNDDILMPLKHAACKYLYFIINVRGFKIVLRHLPHEVSIVDSVLKMLEDQNPNDKDTWQTRHVLLIWMSIIVIIPFPLCRLDPFDPNVEVNKPTTMQRIMNQIKLYIPSGNMTQVAAFLAGRFINRTDVKQIHMKSFLDWCCVLIMKDHIIDPRKIGGLACIASILKHGKRIDLLPYANELLSYMLQSNYRNDVNVLARKYGVKVIQRIGLTFLKPRIAKWRYKRGCRSLMANLAITSDHCGDSNKINNINEQNLSVGDNSGLNLEEDEPYDVPNEIEEVIEELLQGLRNSDTTIRWSAAKGIGRITGRLPLELADEVVGSVLELFSFMEADSAWHGGCLALAELGRRGLLLPSRLPEVVKLVLKALVYDEPRGYTSTGRHIRDAACYVCWSFARAYSVEIIRPHVQEIAGGLLITAVFDREIHCRRAASAAFQENVGRQGSFPHGIEIVTTADYFAVSVRSNAYLNISHFIAGFSEYTHKLINHLVERKVEHWDCAIRELAAQALGKLTSRAPDYQAHQILPKLLSRTKATEINARHGSVYAIGHIILALSEEGPIENYLSSEIMEQISLIVPNFKEKQQLRGIGGELLKQACSVCIECCSKAALPFHDQPIIEEWLTLLADCLTQEVPVIRNLATKALLALALQYLNGPTREHRRRDLINEYTKQLNSPTQVVRMGFAQAIGSLPSFIMGASIATIVPALIESTRITEATLKWAESRREALRALASIIENVGCNKKEPTCLSYVEELFKTFLEGLQEYTLDARGDIGAWVREASMSGLWSLTNQLNKEAPSCLTEERMKLVIGGLAQQAVEKIDRTRSHAGRTFAQIIHSEPSITTIPHLDQLLNIFPKTTPEHEVQWLVEAETFPRFVQMISMRDYTYNLILGFVLSVGGLSETLVKHSSSSLFAFIKSIQSNKEELTYIANIIIEIFNNYQFNSRVIQPLLVFLDRLLGSGTFQPLLENEESDFPNELLKAVRTELSKCKDIPKHLAAEDVLCQLIQAKTQVCTNSLTTLCRFLGHRFIYIRKSTANKLYEALMLYGEEANFVESERLEKAMSLLCETSWDQDLQILIPIRKEICDLLGVPEPKLRTPASQLTT